MAVYGAVVATEVTFLSGLHISLTATAVLLLVTAAASLALRGHHY